MGGRTAYDKPLKTSNRAVVHVPGVGMQSHEACDGNVHIRVLLSFAKDRHSIFCEQQLGLQAQTGFLSQHVLLQGRRLPCLHQRAHPDTQQTNAAF
jgi:hypothetical protein